MAAQGQIVDILKASKEQLEALPNIGPAKAKRIIEFREKHAITEENLSKVEPQLEILLKKGLIFLREPTLMDVYNGLKMMHLQLQGLHETIKDLNEDLKSTDDKVKQVSEQFKVRQETTEHKFTSLATDRNECNTSVQEKSLQIDGKR